MMQIVYILAIHDGPYQSYQHSCGGQTAPSLQTIRCKEMAQTMKKQDCLCLRWKALTPDRLALQIAENYLS